MKNNLYELYKINRRQIQLSAGQRTIFDAIVDLAYPRMQIIAPTQYGKSLTVGLATLTSAVAIGERWVVLAPSEKKASIIMGYVIEHAFDDPLITQQLELDTQVSLDRLRRERSRTHLTFKTGGGVMVLTLDARNQKRSFEAAMGFGGNRIILDESALIDDALYATVKRMLGGYAYSETFLLEIGNPFYRNHFYRTWHSDRYQRIFIDYRQALAEGRFSHEFIEEMRQEAFFDVFYECLFPSEDVIDERGYRTLITNEEIDKVFVDEYQEPIVYNEEKKIDEYPDGLLRLGVDIGGGGDYNVYVLRNDKYAWVENKNRSNDTMTNVEEIQRIKKEHPNLKDNYIFIDDVGVGRGVSDRLKELGLAINSVSAGEKPMTTQAQVKYKNKKAEAYWLTKQWFSTGGTLVRHDGFRQLTWIKYKTSTDKVLQIEPKLDLKKRTGKSPDFAEALMLTFVPPPPDPSVIWI